MFHLVRKEYGYEDEYILDKPFGWLNNCISVITEDRYNQNLQLAGLVQLHIGQIMGSGNIKIPTRSDLVNKKPESQEIKDSELSNFGLGF